MSNHNVGFEDVINVDGFNAITGRAYVVHLTSEPEKFTEMVESIAGERHHIHVNCPIKALGPNKKKVMGRLAIAKMPENVSSSAEVYVFLRPEQFHPLEVEQTLISKMQKHECLRGVPWEEIIRATMSGKMTPERQLIAYLPDPPKVIVIVPAK